MIISTPFKQERYAAILVAAFLSFVFITPLAYAEPLSFSVLDPVGDNTGPIDVTKMEFSFDNSSGAYSITLTASAANPFLGNFRVNINLMNGNQIGLFSDTFNDFNLAAPITALTLTGISPTLTSWNSGDQVLTNNLPIPPGFFRSSVISPPFTFLTNEDYIAFSSDSQPAIIGTAVILPNQAPNGVITTPSQTITAGASVTFTGTATDPDTSPPFTHLWTFGNGSGIPNASAANPGARTFNTEGTFTVTYRVTDGAGLADPTPATITIRVTPINQGATLTATFQGKGFCDDGAGGAEPDNETVPATVVIDFDNFPEITLTISGNFPTAVLEGFAFAKNAKGGVFGVQADGVILNGKYKSKNGQVTSLKGSFAEVFDDGIEQCVSVGKFQAK